MLFCYIIESLLLGQSFGDSVTIPAAMKTGEEIKFLLPDKYNLSFLQCTPTIFFFFFNVKLKVRLVWLGSSRSLITNQNSTKVSWGGKKKYRSHDKHLFLKNWKKWKHFLHSFVFSLLHNFFRSIKITYQEEFCFCFSFLLIFITRSKTDPFFESVRTAGTAQQPWYTLERYQNNG